MERVAREKLGGVAHNYVDGNLPETTRSARIAVENTGQTQAIHFHRHGEMCNPKCYTLTAENVAEGM